MTWKNVKFCQFFSTTTPTELREPKVDLNELKSQNKNLRKKLLGYQISKSHREAIEIINAFKGLDITMLYLQELKDELNELISEKTEKRMSGKEVERHLYQHSVVKV